MSTTHPNRAARRELAERLAAVILPPRLPAADRLVESLEQAAALSNLLANAAETDNCGFHFLSADHVQAVCRAIEREAKVSLALLDTMETPDVPAPVPCPDPLQSLANVCFELSADERDSVRRFGEMRHSDDLQAAIVALIRRGLRAVAEEGVEL